ncbi:flagellar biosynthetic protein FliR [Pseudoduganella ginsengisoli]|uniref:Flagellar biosynthetic protein FliR n=1 Tax=Pseudoduganella ginsengisoli TaxID=1462440 RepID=A0A6L6Q7Y2_9BURK|nr:flagellar biosynthetic protein FliR [Pseudoduganella ginsengisoli]MTW05953.1 flagellar biosynthetic protein FliR [Pseudoduganella ginsengisoli]
MRLDFNAAWIAAVLLCSLRLSAVLMLAPPLQVMGLPVRVRMLFILALSVALVAALPPGPAPSPHDAPALLRAAAGELCTGALMGFGIHAAFAAFGFAGNALDLQTGFNIANLFDPVTHSQSPLLATLLGMVAVMLFFTLDMHHTLLRGFAWSLQRLPLGAPLPPPAPDAIVRQFGTLFTLGLMLAAPVLFCLFLLELALAVLSRNLPQMNIFVLGAPVKIAAGLALLAAMSGHIGTVARRVFDGVFDFWEAVL